MPRRQYAPVCGMNLVFGAAAAPFFYFPLQGDGQPYRRFDDIWGGVVAKRLIDGLGWHMAAGEPFVEHRRASDPFVNAVKEAPGIAFNEVFWTKVDAVPLTATEPRHAVRQMATGLFADPDPYVSRLGRALEAWAGLFERRPNGL